MADLLVQAGIDPARIALDQVSRDTLENVSAASAFIRAEGLEGAVVCTDGYHVPRCRMLLAMLGVKSRPGPVHKGYAGTRAHWLRMVVREIAAYPYDFMLAAMARRKSS